MLKNSATNIMTKRLLCPSRFLVLLKRALWEVADPSMRKSLLQLVARNKKY